MSVRKPNKPKYGRPPGPSQRTVSSVLAATSAVLKKQGYGRTTIEKIAERAGVAKTTIYRWWPSRIMLFMALFEDVVTRPLAKQQPSGTLESDLIGLYCGLSRLLTTTSAGEALVGMIVEAQFDKRAAETFRGEFSTRGRVLSRAILQRAKDRGEIAADRDVELITSILSGSLWYRLLLGDLGDLGEPYVESFVRVVLDGIRITDPAVLMTRSGAIATLD